MSVKLLPCSKEVPALKAPSPIDVTELGIVIKVAASQRWKAYLPIVMTEWGIVTVGILRQ
jgi:hypothetical protein